MWREREREGEREREREESVLHGHIDRSNLELVGEAFSLHVSNNKYQEVSVKDALWRGLSRHIAWRLSVFLYRTIPKRKVETGVAVKATISFESRKVIRPRGFCVLNSQIGRVSLGNCAAPGNSEGILIERTNSAEFVTRIGWTSAQRHSPSRQIKRRETEYININPVTILAIVKNKLYSYEYSTRFFHLYAGSPERSVSPSLRIPLSSSSWWCPCRDFTEDQEGLVRYSIFESGCSHRHPSES